MAYFFKDFPTPEEREKKYQEYLDSLSEPPEDYAKLLNKDIIIKKAGKPIYEYNSCTDLIKIALPALRRSPLSKNLEYKSLKKYLDCIYFFNSPLKIIKSPLNPLIQIAPPLNQILYGPSGTGKTYTSIKKALEILDGKTSGSKIIDKAKFDQYVHDGKIVFTTFYPDMNYGDFIEDIKPYSKSSDKFVRYPVIPGIFKKLCESSKNYNDAIANYNKNRQTSPNDCSDAIEYLSYLNGYNKVIEYYNKYNHSIPNPQIDPNDNNCDRPQNEYNKYGWDQAVNYLKGYNQAIADHNNNEQSEHIEELFNADYEYLLGWNKVITHYNRTSQIKIKSDLSYSNHNRGWNEAINYLMGYNQAIADYKNKVQTDNTYDHDNEYTVESHENGNNKSLQPNKKENVSTEDYESSISEIVSPQNFVLIIDDINRGNIANIFGESISLIEENKRLGNSEELTVTLPFSDRSYHSTEFKVPNNLYIIGTMNNTDNGFRSIDATLQRRFKFIEMLPQSNLLDDSKILAGNTKSIKDFLETLNARITILSDRDHQIGHSYFMEIKNLNELIDVIYSSIIPLLQKYFPDDYESIHNILGKGLIIDNSTVLNKLAGAGFSNKYGKNYEIADRKMLDEEQAINDFFYL